VMGSPPSPRRHHPRNLKPLILGIDKHMMPSTPRRRHEVHRWCGSGAEADLFVQAPLPPPQRRSTTCKTKP
jgi:hypothetical protein